MATLISYVRMTEAERSHVLDARRFLNRIVQNTVSDAKIQERRKAAAEAEAKANELTLENLLERWKPYYASACDTQFEAKRLRETIDGLKNVEHLQRAIVGFTEVGRPHLIIVVIVDSLKFSAQEYARTKPDPYLERFYGYWNKAPYIDHTVYWPAHRARDLSDEEVLGEIFGSSHMHVVEAILLTQET